MKHEFKVGDHVGWNSEASHVRGTIKKKVASAIKFKALHGASLEGGAAIFDQKRHDRPFSHAQGIGAQETQKQTMSALKIKNIVDGLEKNTAKEKRSPLVMTIGHSTRTLAEFIRLLQAHGVSRVVDVRTMPRSWHNPQFNKDSLPGELQKVGLEYTHMPGLGGLRHTKTGSLNVGWRNSCFRSYADYMQTPAFERSLDELVLLAKKERVALMCAKAVPWRCHRPLIADALLVRGIRTEDIMSPTHCSVHKLTLFAKIKGQTITYPAEVSRSNPKKPSVNPSGLRPKKPLKSYPPVEGRFLHPSMATT